MRFVALTLAVASLATVAVAQTTTPATPPSSAPTTSPDRGGSGTSSTGVVHPGNPDPGITVQPPAAGITPVVPPPGTGGNNPTVVPK